MKIGIMALMATMLIALMAMTATAKECNAAWELVNLSNGTMLNNTRLDPAVLTSIQKASFNVVVGNNSNVTAINLTFPNGSVYNVSDQGDATENNQYWTYNYTTAHTITSSPTAAYWYNLTIQNDTDCVLNVSFKYIFRDSVGRFTMPSADQQTFDDDNITFRVNFSYTITNVKLYFGNEQARTMDGVNGTVFIYRLNATPTGTYEFYATATNLTNGSDENFTTPTWRLTIKSSSSRAGTRAKLAAFEAQQVAQQQLVSEGPPNLMSLFSGGSGTWGGSPVMVGGKPVGGATPLTKGAAMKLILLGGVGYVLATGSIFGRKLRF